ncbi:hypothetical protein HPHPP3_0177 [Helicobacter pylori Hp P-3]|nr:hypothetical protein HPHPP3_0177 [Helicobacter pylori Hp P-3]EJC58425.1 hypothetical protein HPHPP3B_0076 [Helicobacter pylori Hp P-3b]
MNISLSAYILRPKGRSFCASLMIKALVGFLKAFLGGVLVVGG